MPHTNHRCECCGYNTLYVGVASCDLPLSIAWCAVCLAMGAQPCIVWDCWEFNGDPPRKENTDCIHFDREQDCYFLGPNPQPITMIPPSGEKATYMKRGDVPTDL